MTIENSSGPTEQEWAFIDEAVKRIELGPDNLERQEKVIRGNDGHPIQVIFGAEDRDNDIVVNGKIIMAPLMGNVENFFEELYQQGELPHRYSDINKYATVIKYGNGKEYYTLTGIPNSST